MAALYDTIGVDYANLRMPDPRIAAQIEAALGPARTVLNVGAMAILTVHHWVDKARGLAEMRRVSRGPVVLLTFDPAHRGNWLADYLPELIDLDERIMPPMSDYQRWLGAVGIAPVPIPQGLQ